MISRGDIIGRQYDIIDYNLISVTYTHTRECACTFNIHTRAFISDQGQRTQC